MLASIRETKQNDGGNFSTDQDPIHRGVIHDMEATCDLVHFLPQLHTFFASGGRGGDGG